MIESITSSRFKPMALAHSPLARLGFSVSSASTASRRVVQRTSATLAPPTWTAPPSAASSFSLPTTSSSSSLSRASLLTRHFCSFPPKMSYTVRKIAQPYTLEHRVYIEKDGVPVSPFHDIPLYANEEQTVLNMVVEIPRWTNAKQEISKDEFLNPIKQDTKKGKLRFVRNCFPHKGYLWNYGAFPRTWEDPNSIHPETKAKGDNDPLDVCEIGELVGYPGQVKQVKVLGVMALIDEEETDWKIIVIDINDPLASKLHDIEDVERHLPGLMRATNEWFRIYKIPDGKPENQFAFSGECKNKKYAEEVIKECSEAWEKLISGKTAAGDISLYVISTPFQGRFQFVVEGSFANYFVHSANTQLDQNRADPAQVAAIPRHENLAPAPIDGSIDKWFFISGAAV
ncbi:Inorganic pyrophosphatase [Penicillium rolfsii]|nr:Inorganic pyrophosphatase [Penicillium rolfsii]